MPDILKVTTPLVNKNQALTPKQAIEPTTPFNIQDPSKVIQTHNQSELLKQNTGMLKGEDAPTLLMSLLRDPAVTVSYLKNIFLLEELYKLLPANNKTVSPEIEQIFHALIMDPSNLVEEMRQQEYGSTQFKGPLFDFLRTICEEYKGQPEVQYAVANLLKSVNNQISKGDILDAVRNSLSYLEAFIPQNSPIAQKLQDILVALRKPNAQDNVQEIKRQVLNMMKDIENSFFFSDRLGKLFSITTYNLSRYNDSSEFLEEAAYRLRQVLPYNLRESFTQLLNNFIQNLPLMAQLRSTQTDSQVMNALITLIARQTEHNSDSMSDAAKIEKMLHSLLSSPCNFTPLLHFILPVQYENLKAFAEIWINPEGDDRDTEPNEKNSHFLLVIDVETMGRFEVELFVKDKTIDLYLFCPSGFEAAYQPFMKSLPALMAGTQYKLGKSGLSTLDHTRSLMDVFKSLPYKRVGVDVKI